MTGIVGYIGKRNAVLSVRNMATRLGLRMKPTTFHEAGSRHGALAASSFGRTQRSENLHRAYDQTVLAIDGEVFGLDALGNNPNATQAEVLFESFSRERERVVTRMRGAFAAAIWEPGSETLTLLTDPHGLRSLYFARTRDRFVFGSRVRAVLAGLETVPQVDETALSEFMMLGMPLFERTLFKEIELVPAGSVLTFKSGTVHVQRYQEASYARTRDTPKTIEQATEKLCNAFVEASEDLFARATSFNVPLSGGLDSRIIAALAARSGKRVETYTMGGHDSPDLKLAPLVASALGLPNHPWVISARNFIDWMDESVYLTDGMYNPMDAQIMAVARRLRNPSAVTLDGTSSLDGLYRFFDPFVSRLVPGFLSPEKHALSVGPDALLDARGRFKFAPLCMSEFANNAATNARRSLADLVANVKERSRGTPFDAFDLMDQQHRVRRFNMMGTVLLRAFSEVRHVFFDPRVMSVVTSLRPEHRSKERLVLARVLSRLSPKLAEIPYERTGMRANATLTDHTLRYGRLAARRVLSRLSKRPVTTVASVVDYRRFCRTEPVVQAYVRDMLASPRSASTQLFGRATLEVVLRDCFSPAGTGTTTFLVGRLLSYELWQKAWCAANADVRVAAE